MNKLNLTGNISKTGLYAFASTSLIKLASLLKVSFIVGSYTALFSATSIVVPLSGAFGGVLGTLAVCGLGLSLKLIISGFISFKYLAYHVPGLFAALYWSSRSSLIRFFVPLVCMAAFIAHPIGGQAWYYSLYWLIPLALYFIKQNNIFLTALGSTLVAHAVGSVIWLYADPMTPELWLALIPLVFIERMVFASGMVVAHAAISTIMQYMAKKSAKLTWIQTTQAEI